MHLGISEAINWIVRNLLLNTDMCSFEKNVFPKKVVNINEEVGIWASVWGGGVEAQKKDLESIVYR